MYFPLKIEAYSGTTAIVLFDSGWDGTQQALDEMWLVVKFDEETMELTVDSYGHTELEARDWADALNRYEDLRRSA